MPRCPQPHTELPKAQIALKKVHGMRKIHKKREEITLAPKTIKIYNLSSSVFNEAELDLPSNPLPLSTHIGLKAITSLLFLRRFLGNSKIYVPSRIE